MTAEAAAKTSDKTDGNSSEPSLDAAPTRRPTPDEDERLRGLIRAELDRQHALPLARRTLELLAEAEAEPTREEPGYRIIDRNGETRLLRDGDADPEEDAAGVTSPMTLRGLIADLRGRHPDLFQAPPEPEVVAPVPPPPPEPPHDALADVKAAGARFVETQSALAKSFATTSAERGRTLASTASGRFEGWRNQLRERFKPTPNAVASKAVQTDDSRTPDLPAYVRPIHESENAGGRHLAGLVGRVRDALPTIDRQAFDLHRVAFIGLAVATVLVIGAVVTMNLRRDAGSPPAQNEATLGENGRNESKDTPKEASKAEPRTETVPPATEAKPVPPDAAASEDAEAAPVEETPRNPDDLTGVPQVIDTATLRLSGKVIHLFGVEWVRGGQAEELTKYIRGRTVTCRPASGSSAFLCSLEGRDLSEVVLFNGGGRASSEASPDLVAAEDHARTERLGVWKR